MAPKIITTFVCPPIPVRSMDWIAYYDGEAEEGHYGYGETEAAAILDFIENHQEDEDERLGYRDPSDWRAPLKWEFLSIDGNWKPCRNSHDAAMWAEDGLKIRSIRPVVVIDAANP
jgi:L-alanine-DL-glutamate epimerase-like enolase superfamily enzyme